MINQNSQFFATLTNVGAAKQANADALGVPWKITQMAIGDANGADPVPDVKQTKLINEVRRAPLNQLKIDPANASVIIAEQVIPADVGGFWIREIGLYDADGDFVAVANCAPSFKPLLVQGSGRTQIVRLNIIVSNAGSVELKIDPSVVLATRAYVDSVVDAHSRPGQETATYRSVTIDEKGRVLKGSNPNTLDGYEITVASQAEAEASADQNNTKPMTSLRVAQAIAKRVTQATEAAFGWLKLATLVQVNAGTDDTTAVTPKKLRSGFAFYYDPSLGVGYIGFPSWLGGYIIVTGQLNSSVGDLITTLPITFPRQFLGLMVCNAYTKGSGQIGYLAASKDSLSTICSRGSSASLGAHYIAIGN